MATNRVKLGSNWYVLAEGTKITRQPLMEWPDNLRLTGQQKRADRAYISSWPMKDFSGGVGLKRINVDNNDHFKRLWDSTAETRWPGQVTPSLEVQAATHAATSDRIVSKPVYFKGDVFALGYTNGDLDCLKWNPGTSNWDKAGDIKADGTSPEVFGDHNHFDMIVHRDKLMATFLFYLDDGTNASQRPKIKESSDGTTWTNEVSFPHNVAKYLPVKLLSFSNSLYLIIYKDGHILFYDTASTAAQSDAKANFYSVGEPTGLCAFWDTSGNAAPFIGTQEGWYYVDITNKKAIIYGDLTEAISPANCKGMVNWNNYLMLPTANAGMIMYSSNGDSVFCGLDLDDGLVAEAQGNITAVTFSNLWLFVAVGGEAAGKYARIWAYDGYVWHFIYRHATADQKINFISVKNGVLHIIYSTGATTTGEKYIEKVLENPINASGVKWNDGSYITLPEYDGGMPEFGMGVYRFYGDADDLIGTDEYLNIKYGVNGAAPTTNLGDITASVKSLAFGADGEGIEATRLQPKIILRRSVNTKCPKFKSCTLSYLVRGSSSIGGQRELFQFVIDAVATVKFGGETRTIEGIIGELDTLWGSKTLFAFEYGRMAAKKVMMLDMSSLEEVREAYNEIRAGEREALITCRLIEM